MSRSKETLAMAVLTVLTIALPARGGYRDYSKAISISGGEDHTLVLTNDKNAWACGPNSWYQLGIGATTESQKTLIRVHGGAMNTPCLQDISDVGAGWKHSLALESYDPNYTGYVWAWGWKNLG